MKAFIFFLICISLNSNQSIAQDLPDMEFAPIRQPTIQLPIEEFDAAAKSINNRYKAAVKSCINQVKQAYSSMNSFVKLKDGYYKAYLTDEGNYTRCYETEVHVEKERVVSYYDTDYKEYHKVKSSFQIRNNKGFVVIEDDYYDTSLQIYFFDVPAELVKPSNIAKSSTTSSSVSSNVNDIYNKAEKHYSKSQFSQAINELDKLVGQNVNHPSVYWLRGSCYYYIGLYDESISDFDKVLKMSTNIAEKNSAYYQRAYAKYGNGDYEGALADANYLCSQENDNASNFLIRGLAKSALGDNYGAIKDDTRAIQLEPNFSMAYNNRGWSKFKLNNFNGAIKDVSKAVELDENNSVAYDSRAEIYFNLKDYKNCIIDCNKAISLDKNSMNSYFIRGRARYRTNRKESACEDWDYASNFGHKKSMDFSIKYCQ